MQKRPEREKARELYRAGMAYNAIAAQLSASKSTVSLWCSDLAHERLGALEVVRQEQKVVREKVKHKKKEKRVREFLRADAQRPYAGYFLYAYHGADGVERVQLVNPKTKQRLSLSRARYMMSVKLRRRLHPDEVVGHRDNNVRNDTIGNLELTTRSEKARKSSAIRHPKIPKECVMCEEQFMPSRPKVETCSKACRYNLVSAILTVR